MQTLWENLFRKAGSQNQIFRLLKENILFKDLNDREISLVQKIMNQRTYRAGEEIFRQGDSGVGMYILISGSVNIFLEETLETQNIKRSLITRLYPGDFFGESALVIEGGKRSATAIAKEDCMLLSFFNPDLQEIINTNPLTGNKILFRLGEVLGTRLRETNKKIITLMSENDTLKSELQRKTKGEELKQVHST